MQNDSSKNTFKAAEYKVEYSLLIFSLNYNFFHHNIIFSDFESSFGPLRIADFIDFLTPIFILLPLFFVSNT